KRPMTAAQTEMVMKKPVQ
ncbi:hypothetical protein D043_5082B, partial [Vibrio parahaemolyticus EKP-021]